jgi:SAM-dependent methyltransferase
LESTQTGHYYRKQLDCQDGVIAWSHRSRFDMALSLLGPSPGKLIDYGSGDGTFLAMASEQVSEGWGADLAEDQIQDCQVRLADLNNLHFTTIPSLAEPSHTAAYDIVTCMETLEHCTDPVIDIVLKDLARLVSAQGKVIISVPIEIGPTFLFKLVIRKLAGLRGLSDYKGYESYSLADACRMIFATQNTAFSRPVYGEPDNPHHSHYQFNWRFIRKRVNDYVTVEKTLFSPLGWTGGWFSSQVWFICRPKA